MAIVKPGQTLRKEFNKLFLIMFFHQTGRKRFTHFQVYYSNLSMLEIM